MTQRKAIYHEKYIRLRYIIRQYVVARLIIRHLLFLYLHRYRFHTREYTEMRSNASHATEIYNLSCEWKSEATSDQLDALVGKIKAMIQEEPGKDTVDFLERLKSRVLLQKPVTKKYEELGKEICELNGEADSLERMIDGRSESSSVSRPIPTLYRMIEPTRGPLAAGTDVMMSEGPTSMCQTFTIDPSVLFAEPCSYDEPEPFISFSFDKPSIPPMSAGPSEWYPERVPLSIFSGTSLLSSRTSGSMGPPASIRPLSSRRRTDIHDPSAQEERKKKLRRLRCR
jgi:hypothetical protein